MATPVDDILRNARAKPLTNEEVNHVIVPISQFLFNKSKENDVNSPDWFADKYNGNGTLAEATAFLIRLFAYSPPKNELLIYKEQLTYQLFEKPRTVMDWQLCKLQARYIYLRNFKDDKLNKFFAIVHQWEAEAYESHLSNSASRLITLDNIDKSLYHICILNPDFFFRKEVIGVMLPKLEGDVGFIDYLPPPPTILALTASDNDTVSRWANKMIDEHTWKPITKDNAKIYLVLVENIQQRIIDRENGNLEADDEWPFKEDLEIQWTALAKTLAAMEPSAIEVVSKSCPSLLKDVQRHLCDVRARTFIPLLRCFVALISVRQNYWSEDSYNESQKNRSDEHPVLLLRLMNSIIDSPFYKPLIEQPVKFHQNDDVEWPLNWWANLIMNVENVHELHDSALKSISRRGFESTRDGDENTKYKLYNNIISVFEKCFVNYEGNERKMQLLFDVLRIYNVNLIETAFTLHTGNSARDKPQAAARGLLQLCMRKDCIRLKRGLNDFMIKFTPWKDYERQLKRKKAPKEPGVALDTKKVIIASDIWDSMYKFIGVTNNIDDEFAGSLVLSNVSSISHLVQLNGNTYDESIVPAHMKNTLLTFRTSYNNAISTIQTPFRRLVQNYLDNSTSHLQTLDHMLEKPNVILSITRLFLSPNKEIHEPIINLLKTASDEDEKSEAIQWLLFKHPKSFLEGVTAQCKTFLSVADMHLEAVAFANRISSQNEEILPMIASPSSGFLSRYGKQSAIKQALLEYWVELCRFISSILTSATKWHKYFENSFMITWMRESITLAGVLLDSEKELQRYITSNSSKMLDPLNEILVQSVGWLKATDMMVLEFTFKFIDSTLSAFKQSGCSPAPKALEKLDDYYRQASKGSVRKLSHLSLSKLKHHLSTLNDESDDDDVQIIDKKPSIGKLQTTLTGEKKPSPVNFLKEKQRERERQEKLKQMGQVKHPFTKKVAGKPLLTGLTAKKGEARKPFVAPQTLTYGGNKKEESESSDDEGNHGGLKDMDLDPEQAKQKMQAVKERRGGTKVIDPLVGTSTKKQPSRGDTHRDESFLRRQRLDPDIGDLQKHLLNVDYNDPNMKIGPQEPIQHIPTEFRNYSHYYDIMRPLLFEETSEQLKQARAAVHNIEKVTVIIAGKTFVNEYAEVVLNVKCDAPSQYSLSENELVTLSKDEYIQPGAQRAGSLAENHPCRDLIAKVQSFRRKGQDLIVTVWLPLRRSAAFQEKHIWKMQKFYSLSTLYREFGALKGLQYYGPVLNKILNPEIKEKQVLDGATVKQTMEMLELNESQANAVIGALCTPADGAFSLIQGPPGTGKSKTILALVAKFLSMRPKPIASRVNPNAADNFVPPKILICAPSNAAIDEVVNRLKVPIRGTDGQMLEVNVIRIGADSSMSVSAKERSLEELVDQRVNQDQSNQGVSMESGLQVNDYRDQLTQCRNKINEIRNAINKKQQNRESATKGETEELRRLSDKRNEISTKLDKARDNQKSTAKARDASRRTHRRAVMMEADVVCSTLSGAGKGDLAELPVEFETVIIDEAAQAVEVSALIPFKYGCKRPILIGDQHQLPPTVMSTEASRKGYSRSLFVRLMETNKEYVHLLNEQYRMHPDISKLPSAVFYNGQLKDGPKMAEKTKAPWHDHELFGTYKFFDFAQGAEKRVEHSYANDSEAEVVISLYERLRRQFGEEFSLDYRIAIIATYKQQVLHIKRKLKNRFHNIDKDILAKVDVNTVDGFQGQEKSVIILSTVRSTKFDNDGVLKDRGGGPIGFLKDIRRMNVALTRAQSSLFIVGNAEKLLYDDTWKQIVEDAKQRHLLQKINVKHFHQAANHVATKAKQPPKHPSGSEKDARNKAKKDKQKGQNNQPPIPDNLVPASNSPVKRKANTESGSIMAKKMKAAEIGQNDNGVKDMDEDGQNCDIPGIRAKTVDHLTNAPALESVSMEADSSSASKSVESHKGSRAMMHTNAMQDDEQKYAIQAAHNKKKQAAKTNSMFIKKKPKK